MTKGVDERIDEDVLRWFSHVERMENDRIGKRAYEGEFASSRSVGRVTDIVKDCQESKENGAR